MADISFTHDHPDLRFYTQEEGTNAAVRICEYDGDIAADGYVEFPLSGVDIFVVAGWIHATDIVRCSTNLVAQNGIVAGGGVDVYGSIHCCGGGIRSGFSIEAKKSIFVRSRIFAGMNGYADSKDCQSTIRCEKFRGELGYGILLLTESWGSHG